MDYNTLLDFTTDLGYRLAMNGAETYRVEESVNLILKAYGIESEAFSLPNCLIVSIETADAEPMTRMRRIGFHGNDLDSVERYSNLSRRICAEHPDPSVAAQWLKDTDASRVHYSSAARLLGNVLVAFGFSILFGSSLLDSLLACICGLSVGIVSILMERLKVNHFFRTIIAAFVMSLLAYSMAAMNIVTNSDTVIIGALMLLVPGLLFTNAMRDIIYGDTFSGINRMVQVFLIAAALALGTGAAWGVVEAIWETPKNLPALVHPLWLQLIGSLIGCIGFTILFNVQGFGGLLCAFSGIFVWGTYWLTLELGGSDLMGYFWGTMVSAVYSEIMARIRKYPALSYLVISLLPLIPGASVYYTMNYAVRGNMASFAETGTHTIAIAGVMAAGILLVSTTFRTWTVWKRNRINK
ncbi:MAG: threonine/serine exporter family protein [Oscillospiraceae bacterium]|nr:threonine/serine exporter family protein [Oscillospiraceae bacterium]